MIPDEICVPEITSEPINDLLPLLTPKRGKNRELLTLATSNAEISLKEKVELENEKHQEINHALQGLRDLLNVPDVDVIEAFDISSLAGTNAVGGMVQFIQGKPSRANYRKYNIPVLKDNNDDTACLQHVVARRYRRLRQEQTPLPDLILVDGGKGQVNAVRTILKELDLKIEVAGMVKNDKHETRSLIRADGWELSLEQYPQTYYLIHRIQDEVHRFAITFHRQKRAKSMISSELDGIPGVGPKRKRLLLQHFQSLEAIKGASVEELTKVGLPAKTAGEIHHFFHKPKK